MNEPTPADLVVTDGRPAEGRADRSRPTIALVGGTGALGGALAMRFADAGFPVVVGSRSATHAADAARQLPGNDAPSPRGMANADAARAADIVIIAVPYAAHEAVLEEIRAGVAGKIVVDATVPLVPPKVATVRMPPEGSAALAAQKRLGDGVRVVSAFQNVAAHKLRVGGPLDCDVLVCADDRAAREAVVALAGAIGLHALDAGPLANSVAAEALTSVLIGINRRYKAQGAGVRITGISAVSAREASADDRVPGTSRLVLTGVTGLPSVRPADDLCAIVIRGIEQAQIVPRSRDVVVVAQKIVSKAEDRFVDLRSVTASTRARELASAVEKDPRLVEVILSESQDVLRYRPGVLVVVHRLGFVMANAGVDQSNVGQEPGAELVLLLPEDPDATCARIKARLDAHFGCDLGIVINDSFGRPWRNGVVGVALGAAGVASLVNLVGKPDLFGRDLRVTEVAVADEVAAAASLLMGESNEGIPVVHVRGLRDMGPPRAAASLIRPRERDLFR